MTVATAVAMIAASIALAAAATPLGRIAESATFDWRLSRRPTPARQDIAIVEINESSIRALAPIVGRWPWPRAVHAGVINYLTRSRAKAIVYDVQFTEADTLGRYRIGERTLSGPESDEELVTAVRRAGNVVLLADAVFESLESGSTAVATDAALDLPGASYAPGRGLVQRRSIQLPFSPLGAASAAVGHNVLLKDPGGVSRGLLPFIEVNGQAVPGLGLAAVLMSRQVPPTAVTSASGVLHVGDAALPLRRDGQVLLKLRGPYRRDRAAGSIPVHSFFDVLLSEEQALAGARPAVPASMFEGKIVFVGTSATGLADVHATAFGGSTPGVYLHATLADNLLAREFIRESSGETFVLITAAAAVLTAVLVTAFPVWWGLGSVAAGLVGFVVAATRLVESGIWMPIVAPAAAVLFTAVGMLAWQFFVEGREKRAVKRLFGRYVSPAIFAELMTNPAVARIGGERRYMSVLFSDIRGFTSASEAGDPQALVAQLNEYLGEMVEALFRHQGTLDKFVGDQVMGLFGAPLDDPLHADHAVAAALDMSATLDRLNERWAADGKPPFEIGIGVHSGDMIAGNVGSDAVMSYTVVGDAVNIGARIEALNKDFGTRILISEATRAMLKLPVSTRRLGEAPVKGRREAVTIHEVVTTQGLP